MELTLLAFFFMGFALGFVATYVIHLGWEADTEAEFRELQRALERARNDH